MKSEMGDGKTKKTRLKICEEVRGIFFENSAGAQ